MEKRYVFVENARSDDYRKKLELIAGLGVDPFAEEHLTDERFDKKNIFYQKEHWTVFTNQHKYPGTKHQFVFVSKDYAEALWDLSPTAQLQLIELLKIVQEENTIPGGMIVTRFGEPSKSGATVSHLHIQLMEPENGQAIAAWCGRQT